MRLKSLQKSSLRFARHLNGAIPASGRLIGVPGLKL